MNPIKLDNMRKRNFLWALFLAVCGSATILTSCHDDDNLPKEEPAGTESREETLRKQLIRSENIDISEIITDTDPEEYNEEDGIDLTDKSIGLWDLREDGTFTYYILSGLTEDDTEEEMELDSLQGTWKTFANQDNPWEENGEKLEGFQATFDISADKDIFHEESATVTYYTVDVEDDCMITMSDFSVDYAYMLSSGSSRGWSWFDDILNAISYTWEHSSVMNWFRNTFGTDSSCDNLNEENSKNFWEAAKSILKEMQKGNDTNYAEWMGEIYTAQGLNPRLCDMNLPGTNQSCTHYMVNSEYFASAKASYNRTQTVDIPTQWNAGVRVFEGDMKSDDTDLGIIMTMSHSYACEMDSWKAVQKIVQELRAHSTETAIFFLRFEDEDEAAKEECRYSAYRWITGFYKNDIIINPKPDITLKECAGKLIIMQGWDSNNSDPNNRLGPSFKMGSNEYTTNGYIKFFNTDTPTECKFYTQNLNMNTTTGRCASFWNQKRIALTQCFEETNKTKSSSECVWAANYVSAYVGGNWLHKSYAKSANTMNPWMVYYADKNKSQKMGIVFMDFASSNDKFDGYYTNGEMLPRIIAETNRWQ